MGWTGTESAERKHVEEKRGMSRSLAVRKAVFTVAVVVTLALIMIAALTDEWLLTAIAVGLAFGFAMQQGGFCGAAILSLVVLLEDRKGVVGAGIAISVAMAGFAVMSVLGVVTPNAKPLHLMPAIIGGLIFGAGMVLAGGCVSGSLFKAGEGRVPSMLALVGIGIGTNMAGPGLFGPWRQAVIGVTREVSAGPGLNDVLGLSYSSVAAVLGVVTFAVLVFVARRQGRGASGASFFELIATKGWSFAAAGLFIGVLGWLAYLSSAACGRNYPLGVTHGVMALFSSVVGGQTEIRWWLALEVMAIVAGSSISAWLRGGLKLRSADASTLLISFLGGVLVGAGAVLAGGCFVGNILSGWALLSIHTLIFGVCVVIANWVTTILYMRGV